MLRVTCYGLRVVNLRNWIIVIMWYEMSDMGHEMCDEKFETGSNIPGTKPKINKCKII